MHSPTGKPGACSAFLLLSTGELSPFFCVRAVSRRIPLRHKMPVAEFISGRVYKMQEQAMVGRDSGQRGVVPWEKGNKRREAATAREEQVPAGGEVLCPLPT